MTSVATLSPKRFFLKTTKLPSGFPWWLTVKESTYMQEPPETQVQSLSRNDFLEEGTVTHSNILAQRISWAKEPRGLLSIGLQRIGNNCSKIACKLPSNLTIFYLLQYISTFHFE